MTYDPECEKLAVYLLSDTDRGVPPTLTRRKQLAQQIQDAADSWIEVEAERMAREEQCSEAHCDAPVAGHDSDGWPYCDRHLPQEEAA